MNVSYRWLQSLAPSIDQEPTELAHRLGLLGAPVDETVDLSGEIGGVVIARVDEVRPHPNADRLRLCTVDAGSGEALQVVCGAPNVQVGGYYPFAPVGATLPGGMEIRRAKLRGERSEGMLCSARELGLGRDHAGLMALSGEWIPGAPLVESLGLEDVRLVLDITPNHPELLSHLGVARELARGGVSGVSLPPFPDSPEPMPPRVETAEREADLKGLRVRIEDAEGCPRYMAAVMRGVRVGPSPEWLASRLRAIGLRPLNNVVDATNYVLHELGQPLHAFDLGRLSGSSLKVRAAAEGERIVTLDGVERTLVAGDLVIADAERPVAIAGVMGGENSEVGPTTTEILLECARFDPSRVRRTARRLGLSTDASYRFERGVDPEGLPRALERVVELIRAVAAPEGVARGLDLEPLPYRRRVLELRPARVSRLLGVDVPAEEIARLLEEIGFDVEPGDPMSVSVPGYRPDVEGEIDLVEEIARRRGYDSFPEAFLPFRASSVPETPQVAVEREMRELFRTRGFLEARSTGFAPAAEQRVPLLNPLSSEESHLRDTLGLGLLRRVERNLAHGVRDVRLFEVGTVFLPAVDGALPREEIRAAAAFTGLRTPAHWSGPDAAWDLWDLKGLLEALADRIHGAVEPGAWEPLAGMVATVDALAVVSAGRTVGGAGRVSREAIDTPAWAGDVWLLEARLPPVRSGAVRLYTPIPEHPAVERDLALLLPRGVSASAVEAAIRAGAGALLESVTPFDLYVGKGIPEDTRSVAFRLRFRSAERTLTDAEVDPLVSGVLQALDRELAVQRR